MIYGIAHLQIKQAMSINFLLHIFVTYQLSNFTNFFTFHNLRTRSFYINILTKVLKFIHLYFRHILKKSRLNKLPSI